MLALILLIFCDVIMVGAFAILYSLLPPEIPLYYAHEWGEKQLGSKWEIFSIPFIINLFFVFLDYYKRKEMKNGNVVMANIINTANIIQMITLTLVFLRIIYIVVW